MRDSKLHLNICTNHNVVIDHGTYTTKVGFSTQDNPTTVLPTVVGHGRHAGAMAALGLKDTYIGSQAQALRGILAISHPIKQGAVQNWDDLEALWEHIWSRELRAPPSDLPALLTHPPANTDDWYKMAEILVEKMEVPALYLANKSVMALYGGGQMTGISVDSGHDTTYIVPSYQGNPIQEATLTLKLGGKQISEQLMQELMNGKYSFPDDNFLLWRQKKNKSKFTVSSRLEIIREMKEQYCEISTNYEKSLNNDLYPETSIRLPDGNMIVMGKETFTAPEILFQPSLANKKSCGLHELIYYSLMKCDEKLRPELLANITLSGGNTKFPGIEKRLYQELVKLLPENTPVRIRALPNRELLGWFGGARLSNLSSFQRFWITKADYREHGADIFTMDTIKLFDSKNGNAASLASVDNIAAK